MSELAPALESELAGPAPLVFGAISLNLPDATVNLLDGSGVLAFGGKTYTGRDPTYGVLAACDNLVDAMGDQAPALSITLLPASDAAAADLSKPDMQGSLVEIYVGAVNPATGAVIASPYLAGLYELDVPTLKSTDAGRELDYQLVSVLERCFVDDEGQRLSPGRQRAIYPNDAGLDDVTGVTQTIYWGVAGNNGITFAGSVPPGYSINTPGYGGGFYVW